MTVKIEGSALSIPESLDSLKVTPLPMHRVIFEIQNTKTWYAIMAEARLSFGKDWRAQPHVKRKLEKNQWNSTLVQVWFEVPDPTFATWCAVKLAVQAKLGANK